MRNPYKKAIVQWVDAVSDSGWKTVEDVLKERPHSVETTGYILEENKEFLTIALSMSYDKEAEKWQANGYFCIPSPWTIKRRVRIR